jgi:hypothetical protein
MAAADAEDGPRFFNGTDNEEEPERSTLDWQYWDPESAPIGPAYKAAAGGGLCAALLGGSGPETLLNVAFDDDAGTMTWARLDMFQYADNEQTQGGYVVHVWSYDASTGEVASQGVGADAPGLYGFYQNGGSGTFDGETLVINAFNGDGEPDLTFTAVAA